MTIAEMKARKKELGYTNEMVSRLSGVPLGTVQKIFAGITESPRYDTLQALENVFKDVSSMVGEQVTAYQVKSERMHNRTNKTGHFMQRADAEQEGRACAKYSTEENHRVSYGKSVEMIDGVLHDIPSPSVLHQLVAMELWGQLRICIKEKKENCILFAAPMILFLDCDDKTVLQPDLFVVSDRSKIRSHYICGAPDFVAEVVSPSTKKKDSIKKTEKYMNAGVREYWIVDPDKKKVVVYDFENDEYPVIYTLSDEAYLSGKTDNKESFQGDKSSGKVPVAILGKQCEIDFWRIFEYVNFLNE